MLSKIICTILKWKKLKGEEKTEIITALLENIDALPIRDAIKFDLEGILTIRGKKLDLEQAQNLKRGVEVLKDNFARKLIQEQLLYEANKIGLHQGLNSDQIMFAKAIVWCLQNEESIINKLLEG